MSLALLERTEPTTDSLRTGPLFDPTSNHVDVGWLGFDRLTPSGEFGFGFESKKSTADRPPLWLPCGTAADQAQPRAEQVWIDDLGEAGYHVLQPIPVEIKRAGTGDFEASFREANIAMSGSDHDDALQALLAEILETFDMLLREQNLGPDAAEQRRILHTYIARA